MNDDRGVHVTVYKSRGGGRRGGGSLHHQMKQTGMHAIQGMVVYYQVK